MPVGVTVILLDQSVRQSVLGKVRTNAVWLDHYAFVWVTF